MKEFEKLAVLENEIESLRLASELDARMIPYAMRSYRDTAYDGLFQLSAGWGHVEAPAEYKDEVTEILAIIRQGGLNKQKSDED